MLTGAGPSSTETHSTSKIRVDLGGIDSPAPMSPYPRWEGMVSFRFSPGQMPSRPSSQPLITWPTPI
ncbi:hypothetical protein TYRP_007300 [Tyrophagus putrescentiae]|nr:hypothetical protein TYRP_007300 [Tyrophagus putrescentiae]